MERESTDKFHLILSCREFDCDHFHILKSTHIFESCWWIFAANTDDASKNASRHPHMHCNLHICSTIRYKISRKILFTPLPTCLTRALMTRGSWRPLPSSRTHRFSLCMHDWCDANGGEILRRSGKDEVPSSPSWERVNGPTTKRSAHHSQTIYQWLW